MAVTSCIYTCIMRLVSQRPAAYEVRAFGHLHQPGGPACSEAGEVQTACLCDGRPKAHGVKQLPKTQPDS